jgi:small-conductance mechanosensitive channel
MSERRGNPQDKRSMRIILIVAIIITLLLVILTFVIAIAKEISFRSPQVIVLFFILFIIIGSRAVQIVVMYLNSLHKRNLADEPLKPGERSTFYRLYCRNCGYEWEMTIDEWEWEGQAELRMPPQK